MEEVTVPPVQQLEGSLLPDHQPNDFEKEEWVSRPSYLQPMRRDGAASDHPQLSDQVPMIT